MELFNFCHAALSPIISCSTVSCEGYEITNLVSSDEHSKRNGFMAYYIIRPPVEITLEFICSINLSHIIIWPQVSGQKSTGFDILTCSNVNPGCQYSYGQSKESHNSQNSEAEFIKIGFGYINNEAGIIFHTTTIPNDNFHQNFLHRRLFNNRNNICNIKKLQIRILKTYQSAVPAIGKLEVWGKPSRSCSNDIRAKVKELWSSQTRSSQAHNNKLEETNNLDTSKLKLLVPHDFEIPEDFIDPITCEIMVLPITLPCGKVVDQSTLEKHKQREAAWGRAPSDPFTGKPFTDVCRPVMAVALKARLDKFLMDHADKEEVQSVPRTVGRKRDFLTVGNNVSKLVNVSSEFKKENIAKMGQSSNKNVSISKYTAIKNAHLVIKLKRRNSSEGVAESKKVKSDPTTSTNEDIPGTTRNSFAMYSEEVHEDILNDSLDSDLKSALSCLPSFLKLSSDKDVPLTTNCCSECKNSETVYQLPCKHLLCRSCLVQKTKSDDLNCNVCGAQFRSSGPVRYHI